jgi:Icc-related predicted phosphoesterase
MVTPLKIRLLSDLHLEASPFPVRPSREDLLILAGDIATNTDSVAAARQFAETCAVPVLMIAGNHEFYRNREDEAHTWESTLDDLRRAADHVDAITPGQVTFLEDQAVVYEGVRFVGATLWTDLKLFGDDPFVRRLVSRQLYDYELIHLASDGNITVEHVMQRHRASRTFIGGRLAEPFDGPTVVITHHAPSALSLAEPYRADKLSAAFASRLDDLILRHAPTLWLHGHTHDSSDYLLGCTRVVCNTRRYPGRDRNRNFDPRLLIEI